MSTAMSAAQTAQQNNRGPGGQYSFGTHAEPEAVALEETPAAVTELGNRSDSLSNVRSSILEAQSSVALAAVSEAVKGKYPAASTVVMGCCDDYDCDKMHLLDAKDAHGLSMLDAKAKRDVHGMEEDLGIIQFTENIEPYQSALDGISNRTRGDDGYEFELGVEAAICQEQRRSSHSYPSDRGLALVRQHGATHGYAGEDQETDTQNLSTALYDLAAFARSRGIEPGELFRNVVEQEGFDQS